MRGGGGPLHSKTPKETPNPQAIPWGPSRGDHPVSCPSCPDKPLCPPNPTFTELHSPLGTPESSQHPQSSACGEQTPQKRPCSPCQQGASSSAPGQCLGGIPSPRGDPEPAGGGNLKLASALPHTPQAPMSTQPHHHGPELHAAGEEAATAELQGFPQVLLAGFGDACRGRGTG